ncbi:MAG: hypothetical protein EA379_07585 [Phycisphaerales bacterium]|nr:MAG: hypothetical protein EA379_07585 [Phycisphaerales bacterium]
MSERAQKKPTSTRTNKDPEREDKKPELHVPTDCEPTPSDESGRDPTKPECPEGYPEEQPTDNKGSGDKKGDGSKR